MKSTPTGEDAEAIRAKAATYASLDDIVLDFSPEMGVAEKLLPIGAYFFPPAEWRRGSPRHRRRWEYATWTGRRRPGRQRKNARDGFGARRDRQLGSGVRQDGADAVHATDIIGDAGGDGEAAAGRDGSDPSGDAYAQMRKELKYEGPIVEGDATWNGDPSAKPLRKRCRRDAGGGGFHRAGVQGHPVGRLAGGGEGTAARGAVSDRDGTSTSRAWRSSGWRRVESTGRRTTGEYRRSCRAGHLPGARLHARSGKRRRFPLSRFGSWTF